MNKKILLLTALFVSFGSHAEISKVSPVEKKIEEQIYTGEKNFLGHDYHLYKGKTLYVMSKPESLREFGYDGFLTTYKNGAYDSKSVYKCCDSFNSKYDEIAERSFKVVDVIDTIKKGAYKNEVYLELKETNNGEVVYFHYNPKYEHSFPFLTVEFYKKLREKYIGMTIYPVHHTNTGHDIETGEAISVSPGKPVNIADIAVDQKTHKLSFVAELGQKRYMIPYDIAVFDDAGKRFYTEKEFKEYRSKFGENNWLSILQRSPKKGMTKEMIRLIEGRPSRISNSTISGGLDQWVYSDSYYYFKDGYFYGYN